MMTYTSHQEEVIKGRKPKIKQKMDLITVIRSMKWEQMPSSHCTNNWKMKAQITIENKKCAPSGWTAIVDSLMKSATFFMPMLKRPSPFANISKKPGTARNRRVANLGMFCQIILVDRPNTTSIPNNKPNPANISTEDFATRGQSADLSKCTNSSY